MRKELSLDLVVLDGTVFEKLESDVVLLVDTLWILCRTQARAVHGITDEVFGAGLGGDCIADATKALLDAITDFFPKDKREVVQTLVDQHRTKRELGFAKAMAMMTDPEKEKMLQEAMETRIQAEFQSLLTRLSGATSSPVSVASTPPA